MFFLTRKKNGEIWKIPPPLAVLHCVFSQPAAFYQLRKSREAGGGWLGWKDAFHYLEISSVTHRSLSSSQIFPRPLSTARADALATAFPFSPPPPARWFPHVHKHLKTINGGAQALEEPGLGRFITP